MVTRNKRGQAAGAAALIAVIAGMIVLYIIFLQPEDRAELLGEDTFTSSGRSSSSSTRNLTLLNESPGRIDFLSQKKIEHSIPTAHVFTQTQGSILEQKDSLTVERSLFSSKDAVFTFGLEDQENTENVLLSFNIQTQSGRLTITLNDEIIIDREITTANIEPIVLPSRLLKE